LDLCSNSGFDTWHLDSELSICAARRHPRPGGGHVLRTCREVGRLVRSAVSHGWSKDGCALPWSTRSLAFAELLIDCEEDRTLRAVLVRMLREADR